MRRAWAALAALGLAGCATSHLGPGPVLASPIGRGSLATQHASPVDGITSVANLLGWREEDHVGALNAFRAGCRVSHDPAMKAACARAGALGTVDDDTARAFFEANFRPIVVPGPGLLTAYFAPEYPARRQPDPEFSAPVRDRPDDLVLAAPSPGDPLSRHSTQQSVNGQLGPYPDRTTIELVPPDHALAWMRPEDLFFLQIQGSGGLIFPDGEQRKAIYAADNGRPFVAIASAMIKRGMLSPSHASGETIHAWLALHRGQDADAVMDLDPRYVFFNLVPDDGRDPAGAAGVPLPAGRAIAVDPAWHAYGELFWIDAVSPTLSGAMKSYRRIVLALDTGSAIKGDVRADLYLGRGRNAGLEAGRVRHTLVLIRLTPNG